MMPDLSDGLVSYVDPAAMPEPSARITVTPSQPAASDPNAGMEPMGLPNVEPPPTDTPSFAEPIKLIPVEHTPKFHHELHPVEHQPQFLTDEQLRQLAAQKDTLAPQSWETGAGKVGADVVQGYKDYASPYIRNADGSYPADHADMTPNAEGKVPEVMKDQTLNSIIAGLDVGSNLIGAPGAGAVKAIMAGVGARLAPIAKLAKAEAFEQARHAPEAIRQATGWFRGADGGWRFEIPDTEARFVAHGAQAKKQLLEQQLENLWQEWGKVKDSVTDTVSDPVRAADISRQMREVTRQIDEPLTMKDILHHPELYKQYPHIADMPVEIKDIGGHIRGQQIPGIHNPPFEERPGKIELDTKSGTNRLTTLHEIQHEVQDTESFARGGNYSTPEVSAEATAATGLRRSELLAEMEQLNARKSRWITHQTGLPEAEFNLLKVQKDKRYPSTYDQLTERFWKENPDMARRLNELEASTLQLNAAHQRALHDAYKRLAGEVESRQVEARAGMTPRELERTPPIQSEDIPRDKQIVIRRGDAASSAEVVTLKSRGGNDIEVLKNPSRGEIERFARDMIKEATAVGGDRQRWTNVRVMRDKNGDLYVWDAWKATHDDVAKMMGGGGAPWVR